ncbi:MAG: 6-pyruvoyl trahydropterin synthase family protein [Candidatus Hydrogenedentota bacterium]
MKVELIKQLVFEAAHSNPKGGPAQQRLHGHSYEVDILASGTPDPNVGWIVDFATLKQIFAPLYETLDHAHLNNIAGLADDTTVPAITRWLDARISPKPNWLDGVRVRILGDLAFAPVRLPADHYADLPDRIRFTFEAAQSLPALPGDHPCKKVHGHSYRIEVAANDLSALEPHLAELYNYFDHQYLNGLQGLDQATVEVISGHIWDWLTARGLTPSAVVVQETPSSRCIYRGA